MHCLGRLSSCRGAPRRTIWRSGRSCYRQWRAGGVQLRFVNVMLEAPRGHWARCSAFSPSNIALSRRPRTPEAPGAK